MAIDNIKYSYMPGTILSTVLTYFILTTANEVKIIIIPVLYMKQGGTGWLSNLPKVTQEELEETNLCPVNKGKF